MDSLPSTSLRPAQAAKFLGIGESTFFRWAKERTDFPKPIKLGPRTTVYLLDHLIAWRAAQGALAKPPGSKHPETLQTLVAWRKGNKSSAAKPAPGKRRKSPAKVAQ
jgi:predicted DNA-binding transcriptional regulator AlpA